MESVLLTSLVDAQENCNVPIVDILNAFIQTVMEDNEDKVVMRIRGHMVDVLVKVASKVYGPYMSTDKQGRKQLLAECLNAIYGTMLASLLYYWKFTRSLKNQGYTMNPYNPFVWNKMIEKKQIRYDSMLTTVRCHTSSHELLTRPSNGCAKTMKVNLRMAVEPW
jgi:hypothetical protein